MKLTDGEMARIQSILGERLDGGISHATETEMCRSILEKWCNTGEELVSAEWEWIVYCLGRDKGAVIHGCRLPCAGVLWPRSLTEVEQLQETWALMAKILQGVGEQYA